MIWKNLRLLEPEALLHTAGQPSTARDTQGGELLYRGMVADVAVAVLTAADCADCADRRWPR
jgi:hypothetical protein